MGWQHVGYVTMPQRTVEDVRARLAEALLHAVEIRDAMAGPKTLNLDGSVNVGRFDLGTMLASTEQDISTMRRLVNDGPRRVYFTGMRIK